MFEDTQALKIGIHFKDERLITDAPWKEVFNFVFPQTILRGTNFGKSHFNTRNSVVSTIRAFET